MNTDRMLNQIRMLFSRNTVLLLSILLMGFSVYFFLGAEEYRRYLQRKRPLEFSNNEQVVVEKIIDGDELKVRDPQGNTTVMRLVGIRTFSPQSHIFQFPNYGDQAIKWMNKRTKGKKAQVRIGKPHIDGKGRLLGSLMIYNDLTGKYGDDIALELLFKGLTLVYTKYPFAYEEVYNRAEAHARANHKGLWGNAEATRLALSLKQMWAQQRVSP